MYRPPLRPALHRGNTSTEVNCTVNSCLGKIRGIQMYFIEGCLLREVPLYLYNDLYYSCTMLWSTVFNLSWQREWVNMKMLNHSSFIAHLRACAYHMYTQEVHAKHTHTYFTWKNSFTFMYCTCVASLAVFVHNTGKSQ